MTTTTTYARLDDATKTRIVEPLIDLPDGVVPGQHAFRSDQTWVVCRTPEAGQGWLYTPGAGGGGGTFAPPPPVPPTRVDLAVYIATNHAALRDGGVTISGMRIKTDAESRGLIDGAYALSQAQPEKTIDFKASSGWVSIDSQTMQTVALAVGRWVQACYTAYRGLDEGRAAGTITTPAQVDAAYAAVTLPTS